MPSPYYGDLVLSDEELARYFPQLFPVPEPPHTVFTTALLPAAPTDSDTTHIYTRLPTPWPSPSPSSPVTTCPPTPISNTVHVAANARQASPTRPFRRHIVVSVSHAYAYRRTSPSGAVTEGIKYHVWLWQGCKRRPRKLEMLLASFAHYTNARSAVASYWRHSGSRNATTAKALRLRRLRTEERRQFIMPEQHSDTETLDESSASDGSDTE